MPIIHVELVEGRTVDEKRRLGEAITNSTVDILKVPIENVRVIFQDMKPTDFMEAGVLRAEKNK